MPSPRPSRTRPHSARSSTATARRCTNEDVHRIHSPLDLGNTTTMINVGVHDIDSHYARATAEGAEITMPLEDAFYGSRRYEATDLEGHRWHFDEPFDSIRARGGVVQDEPATG